MDGEYSWLLHLAHQFHLIVPVLPLWYIIYLKGIIFLFLMIAAYINLGLHTQINWHKLTCNGITLQSLSSCQLASRQTQHSERKRKESVRYIQDFSSLQWLLVTGSGLIQCLDGRLSRNTRCFKPTVRISIYNPRGQVRIPPELMCPLHSTWN